MKWLLTFIMLAVSSCHPVWAADYLDVMLGWTDAHGVSHKGALFYEGCTPKNPLGKQNIKADPGNSRHGVNCGGTVAGICCRDNPSFPSKTATIDDVMKYYRTRWDLIHGDEIKSPYLAFKLMRLSVNMGDVSKKNPAIVIMEKTINDLNGKDKDFPLTGGITPDMMKWLNDFTAPEALADGSKSQYRRWFFFERMKALALLRYGGIIAKNPKLAVFWDNWSEQTEFDR